MFHHRSVSSDTVSVHRKCRTAPPDNTGTIEFVLQRFKPNSNSGDAVQSHEGEEVFFVLKGQLVLFLDQMELVLNQGDSVRIPAKTPHFWVNQTDSEVEVIFAITPPAF